MTRERGKEPIRVFRIGRRELRGATLSHGLKAAGLLAVLVLWLSPANPVPVPLPATGAGAGAVSVFELYGLVFAALFGGVAWYEAQRGITAFRAGRDPRLADAEIRVDAEGVTLADGPAADARLRLPWREVQDVWSGQEFLMQRPKRWYDRRQPVRAVFLRTGAPQPRGLWERLQLKRRAARSAAEPLRTPDFVALPVGLCQGGGEAPYRLMRDLHARVHYR